MTTDPEARAAAESGGQASQEDNRICRSVATFSLVLRTVLADTHEDKPPSHRSATGTLLQHRFRWLWLFPVTAHQNSTGVLFSPKVSLRCAM